jgi:hypothetical protein
MAGRDVECERWWLQGKVELIGLRLKNLLARKHKPVTRVRLMTRGEGLKTLEDVQRVRSICLNNPHTLFWLPTRGWRNSAIRALAENQLMNLPNLALNASMDPSNTAAEWASLKASGWSTMFYGDDTLTTTPNGDRMFPCPKTHKGMKGHCMTCKAGCFGAKTSYGKRTDVHLSQH